MTLKKQVNETKTEAELYVQYQDREMLGKHSCSSRLHSKTETGYETKINALERQLKTEQLVSDRIRRYMERKTNMLVTHAEDHDKVKDKKVELLQKEKDDILKKKMEHESNIEKINGFIENEDEERRKREKEEEERQEKLEKEKQMKIEMEDAARYIQRKWEWY